MLTADRFNKIAIIIFIISAVLRIGLTAINREANDNHVNIARIILNEHRLPASGEDWEGFQPKLYHVILAVIGWALPFGDPNTRLVLIGQSLSCLAGLASLGLAYKFLQQIPLDNKTRLICFAFSAFNPKIIGIHAQATNDSFVILFGALGIYATTRYLQTGAWRYWIWLTGAVCLAGLTKGNGLVFFPILPGVVILALIWQTWSKQTSTPVIKAKQLGSGLLILGVSFAILVPVPGQYYQRFKESGSPFTTNMPAQPMSDWSKRSYVARPGIISIYDGFFTFPLDSLLEYPAIGNQRNERSTKILIPGNDTVSPNDKRAYPLHMVSFWAQLYGRSLFVHFDQWPPTWQTRDAAVLNLGRLLFLLGILPTAIWLIGLFACLWSLFRLAPRWQNTQIHHLLHLVCVAAFLAFLVFYALRIRDFSVIKAIFYFPAWLSFIFILAIGLERIWQFKRWRLVPILVIFGSSALVVLFVLDILCLIGQLLPTALRV